MIEFSEKACMNFYNSMFDPIFDQIERENRKEIGDRVFVGCGNNQFGIVIEIERDYYITIKFDSENDCYRDIRMFPKHYVSLVRKKND